jgi:RTX calcium-binding nonapeptide repeat (4 copies)
VDVDFGVHLNQHWISAEISPMKSGDENQALMYPKLKSIGARAARFNTDWSSYQTEPTTAFDPASANFDDAAYAVYLVHRGYGLNGASLINPFQNLLTAYQNNIRVVFNFGGIPDWAKRDATRDINDPYSLQLKDNEIPAQYLFDFIIYCARQPEGRAVLQKMAGFQIYNEVNGGHRQYQPGYGFRSDQMPHKEYFEVVDYALKFAADAYAAINLKAAPPIIAPSLATAFSPGFLDQVFAYQPKASRPQTPDGGLAITHFSLNPYGSDVRPYIVPQLEDTAADPIVEGWALRDNFTFRRLMMPTDDLISIKNLIARDPKKSATWHFQTYADQTNGQNKADDYFDRNTGQGVERTMAHLWLHGYENVKVNFTEFGASTYVGDPKADAGQNLWLTTFADPYKYGYYSGSQILPQSTAENLQAESLMQAVGLTANWDFVDTATAYELYDYDGKGLENQFGLAYSTLDAKGQMQLKPAGLAFQAYVKGQEFHQFSKLKSGGVDIHIFANSTSEKSRHISAHELILLRGSAHKVDGGLGDDIIFGGPNADEIAGGPGFDKLYGGPGSDILNGGPGADRMDGGSGNDVITGGLGADNFAFAAYANQGSGNAGQDVITDFDGAEDTITIIGGFSAEKILELAEETQSGTLLSYARNGAKIMLQNIKKAGLKLSSFHVLEADLK